MAFPSVAMPVFRKESRDKLSAFLRLSSIERNRRGKWPRTFRTCDRTEGRMNVGKERNRTGLALLAALLAAASPAWATDLESVEALIRQGVELRQQRHDVRALPLFQKAYSMSRTPRTAGQLGLCEMALGYWLDSEYHLSEALNVPEHPWVSRNLADLTGALASVRTNISDVTVGGGPVGAQVLVNGQLVGRLPLSAPVRLGRGAADVELRAPGYVSASRPLRVPGGTQETVTIDLARLAPEAPEASAAGLASLPATSTTPTTIDQPRTTASSPRRVTAWATGGGAALGLIFGVVETINWVGKQNDFDSHIGPLPLNPMATGRNCGAREANYGGPGCQTLHDDYTRARTLSFVGYGVAAAFGVTSALLFATSSPTRTSNDIALTCAPDVLIRGAGCVLPF